MRNDVFIIDDFSNCEIDEGINRKGEKVKITPVVPCDRWILSKQFPEELDRYRFFYDEDELYHLEDMLKKEVVKVIRCDCCEDARLYFVKYVIELSRNDNTFKSRKEYYQICKDTNKALILKENPSKEVIKELENDINLYEKFIKTYDLLINEDIEKLLLKEV